MVSPTHTQALPYYRDQISVDPRSTIPPNRAPNQQKIPASNRRVKVPRLYFDPLTGAFKKIIMSDNEALEECTSHMPQRPFRNKIVRIPFVVQDAGERFGRGVPWLTGLFASPYYDWTRRDSAIANDDQAIEDDFDAVTVVQYSNEREVYEREIDFAFEVPQVFKACQAAVRYPSKENVFEWLCDSARAYGDQYDAVDADVQSKNGAATGKRTLRRKKCSPDLHVRYMASEVFSDWDPVLERSLAVQSAAAEYSSEEAIHKWLFESAGAHIDQAAPERPVAYDDPDDAVDADLRVGDSAAMEKRNLRRKKKCSNLNLRFRSSESVSNSHRVLEGSPEEQSAAARYLSEEDIHKWLFDSARAYVDQATPDGPEALSGDEVVAEKDQDIQFGESRLGTAVPMTPRKAAGFGVHRTV